MCRTPWCFGDCEECIKEQAENDAYSEFYAECPHRKECNLNTKSAKEDVCSSCGKSFNY